MSLFSPSLSLLPSTPSCNKPDLIMTGSEKPHEASGGTPSEKGPKADPKIRKFDPKKAWIVAPDGDLVLYTPGKAFGVLKTIPDARDAGFLVSSAHLKLSSKYFKTLLSARWSEGRASAAGDPIQVEINDCQPDTLYLILNIIHGHTRSVPREISLEKLAELSIAVDFLQCEEVVEFHAQMWIQSLKPQVPTSWSPMVPTWLMISCVFNDKDIQSKTMELASEEGTAPFTTNGLPIPSSIKDKIDQERESYLSSVLLAVEKRISNLVSRNVCSPKCNAAYLGALMIKLAELKILFRPTLASEFSLLRSTTIQLTGLSPSTIRSMVTQGERGLRLPQPCSGYSCSNRQDPWGENTLDLASKKCAHIQALKF